MPILKGEINKGDFKKISGGMGSYAQRDGKTFMIRLRTPSGLLSLPHLTFILSYARKYKLERIHLTTRQAIQLHDLEIEYLQEEGAETIQEMWRYLLWLEWREGKPLM